MRPQDSSPTLEELSRFANRFTIEGGHWIWDEPIARRYGTFWFNGKAHKVHRLMVAIATGRSVPKELEVDHLCGVTMCINPKHLEPVTPQVNKERSRCWTWRTEITHCPRGHEYTPENTYMHPRKNKSGDGFMRVCRTCTNLRRRK